MYKRSTRTTVSSLLAVPLTAALASPVLAAPPDMRVDAGSRTVVTGMIVGEVDGREGNVHELALAVGEVMDGKHATGYLDSYACSDGVDSLLDPSCELVGQVDIKDGDWTATQAEDLSSATVVGDLGLWTWACDDETGCSRVPAGSLSVDLALTAIGDPVRTRETFMLRWPDARFLNILGRLTQEAAAAGTVGGAELSSAVAHTDTFTFRAIERME